MQIRLINLVIGTCLLAGHSLPQAGPNTIPVYMEADREAGKNKAMMCASCHGADGNSSMPGTPSLAAQPARYILKQLSDYQSGKRQNAIMSGMAAALDEQSMRDISTFFSMQELQQPSGIEYLDTDRQIKVTPKRIERGKELFLSGRKPDGIPACNACHGHEGHGNAPSEYPAVRFQSPAYLAKALDAFASHSRSNDPSEMMRDIASRLTEADRWDIIAYLISDTE